MLAGAVVVLLEVLVSPPPPVVDAPLFDVVLLPTPVPPLLLVAPPLLEVALTPLFDVAFDVPEVELLELLLDFEPPLGVAL